MVNVSVERQTARSTSGTTAKNSFSRTGKQDTFDPSVRRVRVLVCLCSRVTSSRLTVPIHPKSFCSEMRSSKEAASARVSPPSVLSCRPPVDSALSLAIALSQQPIGGHLPFALDVDFPSELQLKAVEL